jgi:hypothetical protein
MLHFCCCLLCFLLLRVACGEYGLPSVCTLFVGECWEELDCDEMFCDDGVGG